MKKIFGISAFYHVTAAGLTEGGIIIATAQEEKSTRENHRTDFSTNAVEHCLEYVGLSLGELDAKAYYDKSLLISPFLKFSNS